MANWPRLFSSSPQLDSSCRLDSRTVWVHKAGDIVVLLFLAAVLRRPGTAHVTTAVTSRPIRCGAKGQDGNEDNATSTKVLGGGRINARTMVDEAMIY